MKRGKVYLVGAGPGDPALITVKGLECLRKADVVIYDRLIDDSLLEGASPDAEKIYVGKGSGCHAMEQKEINLLIVRQARGGQARGNKTLKKVNRAFPGTSLAPAVIPWSS